MVPNFRIRTIPVLGTTPAIFGLAAAAHILCELAGAPFVPEPCFHIQVPALLGELGRRGARTWLGTMLQAVGARLGGRRHPRWARRQQLSEDVKPRRWHSRVTYV